MELKLIEQSDEMKFQEWFDKHDGDLLCMECEDIARQSFMAGMKSAQQSMHWTLPMCSVCGESVARKSGICEDCEMLARQSQ